MKPSCYKRGRGASCLLCVLKQDCEGYEGKVHPVLSAELTQLRQMLVDVSIKFNEGLLTPEHTAEWTLDCREMMLNPEGSRLTAKILFEMMRESDCTHVAGPVMSGIPLVAYAMHESENQGKSLSGLIIRREPKRNGLRKLIEGDPAGKKVVLIDDLVNSGSTLKRNVGYLEQSGCIIQEVIVLVNFKGEQLDWLKEKGIRFRWLFDMRDLGLKNRSRIEPVQTKVLWQHKLLNKRFPAKVPRSTPVQYRGTVLFGTNEGIFYCMNAEDGKIIWQFQTNTRDRKGILSNPLIHEDKVLFGAYNGYLYCLDAATGKPVWQTKNCDQIGSSPCIFEGKVYIGLEFGLVGGALAAYSLKTGDLLWHLRTRNMMHSSPNVDKPRRQVISGCNDGFIYCADTDTGKLKWKYEVGKETRGGIAIDEENALAYFGSETGCVYCINTMTGEEMWKRKVGRRLFTDIEIIGDRIVFSTVSKRIFCIDRFRNTILWYYNTDGETYSYTRTADGKVYCGAQDGHLYVLDLEKGRPLMKYVVAEESMTRPLVLDDRIIVAGINHITCFEK
jgi:outer membrane protein assembly factor BamB/orotate phosphoribosyltransferase